MINIDRVENLIKEKGWKKPYFCEKMGHARNWIADWKRGKGLPDENGVLQIADLLDTTVDFLTGKTDEKKKPETDDSLRLSKKEIEMIKSYRALNPEIQAAIDHLTGAK
ncbi:repressor LexA [Sporobacter termitidis DSM 10068]|uniref:Repressor LexA n=1 Tax=Sporobacter termitidis DSM 10068 TaxID=1123282 RepID=A0A1M5ZHU2_9FIRM|nr:hypothetical protein [Sporobacter termitidis]SHI23877.1 repressor LexA [Sporobacter termitidis DSM 10068]